MSDEPLTCVFFGGPLNGHVRCVPANQYAYHARALSPVAIPLTLEQAMATPVKDVPMHRYERKPGTAVFVHKS